MHKYINRSVSESVASKSICIVRIIFVLELEPIYSMTTTDNSFIGCIVAVSKRHAVTTSSFQTSTFT